MQYFQQDVKECDYLRQHIYDCCIECYRYESCKKQYETDAECLDTEEIVIDSDPKEETL